MYIIFRLYQGHRCSDAVQFSRYFPGQVLNVRQLEKKYSIKMCLLFHKYLFSMLFVVILL